MRHCLPSRFPIALPLLRQPCLRPYGRLLAGGLLLLAGACAQAADLFVVTAPNRFAATAPGVYPLRVNGPALLSMAVGDRIRLNLPDRGDSLLQLDRLEQHASGNTTWIGHVEGQSSGYRTIITIGANGAIGELLLPDGAYRIEANQVVVPALTGEISLPPAHTDSLAIPAAAHRSRPAVPAADNSFAASATTRIDVMILYTQGMKSTTYAGGVDALIDHLIALTNQAYRDSGVAIELHLVHKRPTDYLEDNANDAALDDLSNASDIALLNVPAWRQQYGADLVTLLRPLDGINSASCGIAWIGGGGGIAFDKDYGYSVVSYGRSVDANGNRVSCSEYTYAHELGHNMGAAHDRLTSNTIDKVATTAYKYPGAFNYSYGYGISGNFGTIMSYIEPRIGMFSNPDLTYHGYPIGAAVSQLTASANNALTLNNTRQYIANYLPMTVDLPLTGIALSASNLQVGQVATIQAQPAAGVLGTCSSSNTAVASINGTQITALAAGTASIACNGQSAGLSVQAPPPPQVLAVTADKQTAGNGNVALSLALLPDAADIGKIADLYLLAHAVSGTNDYWFIRYANGSWAAYGSSMLPFSTRTLSATEDGISVFAGEFSEATLKNLALDVYLGYTLSGASLSTLKYRLAYSFR